MDEKVKTVTEADLAKVIRVLTVKAGPIGRLLQKISDMDSSGPTGEEAQNILDYFVNPDSNIARIAMEGNVITATLHEDFEDILSENGLEDVFNS